jgi:hydrogenase maturation protein HypF
LKSVFTLARGRFAYQSQHLGDLENLAGLAFFEESLAHLMGTFEIEPELVVRDIHPGYLSSTWAERWASERRLPVIQVQHHHAHIAACMAEHGIAGPVIGLSLDGTGYGTDGRIWGGEVLVAQLDNFKRFAHLAYVPMPGGEAAIREPWRMAFAHLRAAGVTLEETASLTGTTAQEARVLDRMIEKGINAPLTSSCGRLFDAVAAVVLKRRTVDYEAQAAIELEGLAVDEPDDIPGYPLTHTSEGRTESGVSAPETIEIGIAPLWQELIADLRARKPAQHIAASFHAGVAYAFIKAALQARTATNIHQVALSGGCLHNRRLARLLRTGLEQQGFQVFQHRQVSPGDGGLSYGQAAIAAAILKNRVDTRP